MPRLRAHDRARFSGAGPRPTRTDERSPLLSGAEFDVGLYRASGPGFTTVTAPGRHLVIQTGGVFVDRSEKTPHVVAAGDVALFRPGRVYTTGDPEGSTSHAVVLTLHERLLHDDHARSLAQVISHPDGPARLPLPAFITIGARRALLAARRDGSPAALEEILAQIDFSLPAILGSRPPGSPGERSGTRRAHRDIVFGALDAIARRPERHWSLQELARQTHTSSFHLSRLVRSVTGCSVGDLITRQRVERAATLLAETDRSIDEIARECGYTHRGRLGVVFRRAVGESPGAFRRRCREDRARMRCALG